MSEEKLVIIDTDCGVDDAWALVLAAYCHKNPQYKIKILAITTVFGNTEVKNVWQNVNLTLKICQIEDLKVYNGCCGPLINSSRKDDFFGVDGLGDKRHEFGEIDKQPDEEHAVNALVKLVKQFPKKISILALGPLTNLAVAQMVYPDFLHLTRSVIILGGNIHALGNVEPTGEFNFVNDPEAAHIVLKSNCTLIPWETTLKSCLPHNFYYDLSRVKTKKAKFLMRISEDLAKYCKDKDGFNACDILTVLALAVPDSVVEVRNWRATVELHGALTRGQLIVDKRAQQGMKANQITIITKFDVEKLCDVVIKMLDD